MPSSSLVVVNNWNVPRSSRLCFVSQSGLSDCVTGLYDSQLVLSSALDEVLPFYPFRAFGVTSSGFRFAVYELRWSLSFSRRFNSSSSAQTIQCFPEGVLRE
jgi:hypothetical protein